MHGTSLPLVRPAISLTKSNRNKTLNGGRAERNEYILLHEFHRLKYICPDKTFGKKSAPPKPVDEEDDGTGAKKGGKAKRDKYKGGLVFEPKRGLWDKYILVMDFNSLYPSIIQEYNIDFTTVDPADEEVVCLSASWQGVHQLIWDSMIGWRGEDPRATIGRGSAGCATSPYCDACREASDCQGSHEEQVHHAGQEDAGESRPTLVTEALADAFVVRHQATGSQTDCQ